MADVEKLLNDYIAEHSSGGEADPRNYLSQVDGSDRTELAALIDSYLSRSPGREWDAQSFEGSRASLALERIVSEWQSEGASGGQGWRELLPSLRVRAKIRRRELVERLADGIGHPGESQVVSAYYHQMELGALPAEGVSNRVLRVLGEIVGETAERLREAGSVVAPGGGDQIEAMRQVSFARTAVHDDAYDDADDSSEPLGSPDPGQMSPASGEESEVDRLFTGGPGD